MIIIYFDETGEVDLNKAVIEKVAEKCYLPMNWIVITFIGKTS
jgi:hypothetical protein